MSEQTDIKNKNLAPVFIVGCYRSGTTLMRMMLNSHSRIHISQETNYIDKVYLNIEHDIINNLELLRMIYAKIESYLIQEKWESWPQLKVFEDMLNKGKLYFHDIVKLIAIHGLQEDKKKKLLFWGDNTPLYANNTLLLNKLFPDAKYIVMLRDPRDVALSAEKLHFGSKTMFGAGLEWEKVLLNMMLVQKKIGDDKVYFQKYESLVTETEQSLNNICDFLEIKFELSMLNFYKTKDASAMLKHDHHQNLARPISTSSIGKYKLGKKRKELFLLEIYLVNKLYSLGYIDERKYKKLLVISQIKKREVYIRIIAESTWQYLGNIKNNIFNTFRKSSV